jgi:hypothetical protein
MTTTTAQALTFGIEIECVIPEQHRRRFPLGGYHAGMQIPEFSQGWNGQRDCSVAAAEGQYGYFGAEIVSPVLDGEDGLIDAWKVLDTLHRVGAKINDNCGFHIHIGGRQFTAAEIVKIEAAFVQYEFFFFALAGKRAVTRYDNRFCKPSCRWSTGYSDRYQSLNLTNALRPDGAKRTTGKGTLEFRLFPGNNMPVWALAWVQAAVAFTVAAVNDNLPMGFDRHNLDVATANMLDIITKDETCQIVPGEDCQDLAQVIIKTVRKAMPALRRR